MRAHGKIRSMALTGALLAGAVNMPTLAQDGAVDGAVGDGGDDDGTEIEITRDMVPGGPARRVPGAPPVLSDPATPEAPRPSLARAAPPSILAILAHPDDELTFAPVLARVAREGGEVTVVFATSGDAGPGVSGMQPGAALAALREDEARCAAFALGVPEPHFWQLGDGRLAERAHAPDSAARTLTANVAAVIAEVEPRVVITWGPDGGYGHADHRMVSNVVTEVLQAMGDDRPDLLFPALPESEDAPDALAGWATTHPSLVTDRIRYEFIDLEALYPAVDCYQSQFDEAARAALPSLLHHNVWRGMVHFRLAFPPTR